MSTTGVVLCDRCGHLAGRCHIDEDGQCRCDCSWCGDNQPVVEV